MKLGKATQLEDGKILMNILTWPLSEKHWDGELVLYPNTNPSQHVSD